MIGFIKKGPLIILMFSYFIASSQNKKTVSFVDTYINVALWNVQGVKKPIIKWSDDLDTIRYRFQGEFPLLNRKQWNDFLDELQLLTGKTFVPTTDSDNQILIYFGELEDYAQEVELIISPIYFKNYNSWNKRSWDNDFNLTKSSFCLVPSKIENSQIGMHYMRKSMLNSLGILGNNQDQYSIFYEKYSITSPKLSRQDKRYIKMHYSIHISAGMKFKELRAKLMELEEIDFLAVEKL